MVEGTGGKELEVKKLDRGRWRKVSCIVPDNGAVEGEWKNNLRLIRPVLLYGTGRPGHLGEEQQQSVRVETRILVSNQRSEKGKDARLHQTGMPSTGIPSWRHRTRQGVGRSRRHVWSYA